MLHATKLLGVVGLAVGSAFGLDALTAGECPPADAKELAALVAGLEKEGYVVVEASFDDGRWEVDAYLGEESFELQVDPRSGAVASSQRDAADPAPPANALPLSKLLATVQQAGYAPITAAEFEHGRWEVEAYRENAQRELRIDAATGKILSDQPD